MMPIEHIADWEKRLDRQDAFWTLENENGPVVHITLPRKTREYPYPKKKTYRSQRERWFDAEYAAEISRAQVMNTEYLADALPGVYPNLGPEVFSAFFGCDLGFGEDTSWSKPILEEWGQVEQVRFSEENEYFRVIRTLTDALLGMGKGLFYTGITDLHPGGDAIAAFRDPAELNLDMIDHPGEVKALLRRVTDTYFKVYDGYYARLQEHGQAIASWPGIVSRKKWYAPSCDFSCMISKKMFDDVFLENIAEECRFYERSVYHLDGPGALRHLDSLLEIKQLNAIQWVYGAGNGRASDWIEVYKKCQSAGKALQIVNAGVDELDVLMENLHAKGLWIGVAAAGSREDALSLIDALKKWR